MQPTCTLRKLLKQLFRPWKFIWNAFVSCIFCDSLQWAEWILTTILADSIVFEGTIWIFAFPRKLRQTPAYGLLPMWWFAVPRNWFAAGQRDFTAEVLPLSPAVFLNLGQDLLAGGYRLIVTLFCPFCVRFFFENIQLSVETMLKLQNYQNHFSRSSSPSSIYLMSTLNKTTHGVFSVFQ